MKLWHYMEGVWGGETALSDNANQQHAPSIQCSQKVSAAPRADVL